MDLDAILQSLDEEIDILRQVRALLTDDTAPLKPVTPGRRKVIYSGPGGHDRGAKGEIGPKPHLSALSHIRPSAPYTADGCTAALLVKPKPVFRSVSFFHFLNKPGVIARYREAPWICPQRRSAAS